MRARAIALKVPVRHARARAFEGKFKDGIVGANDLGGRNAMQLGFQLGRRAFGDAEFAAGQVQPGQAGARRAGVAGHEHGGQRAVGLGGQ
ncbi:hypothetical protein D3C73_1364310 [compost metagenome]